MDSLFLKFYFLLKDEDTGERRENFMSAIYIFTKEEAKRRYFTRRKLYVHQMNSESGMKKIILKRRREEEEKFLWCSLTLSLACFTDFFHLLTLKKLI
jgi:hypothetical protein